MLWVKLAFFSLSMIITSRRYHCAFALVRDIYFCIITYYLVMAYYFGKHLSRWYYRACYYASLLAYRKYFIDFICLIGFVNTFTVIFDTLSFVSTFHDFPSLSHLLARASTRTFITLSVYYKAYGGWRNYPLDQLLAFISTYVSVWN